MKRARFCLANSGIEMRSSRSSFWPSAAIQCSASIVGNSSIVYDSLRGLPCSRLSSSVSSSSWSMTTWAVRRMVRARSASGRSAQNGWTRATSSTTPCTWSGVIVGTAPRREPSKGLKDSS